MATAHHIQVAPTDSGLLKFEQDTKTANEVTALLQKDLESHNVFFNPAGFHNHIVHHLLSLYGTGASVSSLKKAYKDNETYQLRLRDAQPSALEELRADYATASRKYIGKGTAFPTWLAFFQGEMDTRGGWEPVLAEYLFAETDTAQDLQARMFAGLLHPIIQLMYGVEWAQPAIIASALAQAAVHKNELGDVMTEVEKLAASRGNEEQVSLVSLLEGLAAGDHEKLRGSSHWEDEIKIRDGVLTRAKPEALELLSRVRVGVEELEERTAEMVHTAAYVAASTAVHAPHVPKYDFFFIHHLNSGPIFLSFNKLPFIPNATRVRMLEWKMRQDVLNYIARGSPPLQPELLKTYEPRDTTLVSQPADLLPRIHKMDDDGHIIKVARSLLIAQEVSQPYADRDWLRIREDKEWLAAHYLLVDSVESGGPATWARQTGFSKAWDGIPKKSW